jgi:hypothetical protein
MPEVASSERTLKLSDDFSIDMLMGSKRAALSPREAQPATAVLRRRSRDSFGRYIIAGMDQVNRNCRGLGFDAQRPRSKFDQIGVLPPVQSARQYDVSISGDSDSFRKASKASSNSVASTAATSDSNFSDDNFLGHTIGCEVRMIRDELCSINTPCSEPTEDHKMSEPNARQNVVSQVGAGFGRPGQNANGNNLAKAGATILEKRSSQLEKMDVVPMTGKATSPSRSGRRRRQEMLAAALDDVTPW